MKKRLTAALVTGAMILAMTGCNDTDVSREREHGQHDRVAEEEEQATPPYLETDAIDDYVPVTDCEYVFPYLYQYQEDDDICDHDPYRRYGLIDQDGNIICDPIFSSVWYVDDAGYYIVSAECPDGSQLSGLLSLDGCVYTGLIYNGSTVFSNFRIGTPGEAYMTIYENGIMHVDHYMPDLQAGNTCPDIVIDESQLPPITSGCRLNLAAIFEDSAVIMIEQGEFIDRFLIDINTGECLYEFGNYGSSTYLFGQYIIESGLGDEVVVHDIRGNQVFADQYDFVDQVTADRLVMAGNGKVDVFDLTGAVVASKTFEGDYSVESASGKIAISTADETILYDADLNPICTTVNVDVDDGYAPDDFLNYEDTDMFFRSYDDDVLYDLSTQASLPVTDNCFFSVGYGYITCDNVNYASDVQWWKIYDPELRVVIDGTGTAELIRDNVTGKVYVLAVDASYCSTTLYYLETKQAVWTIDTAVFISDADIAGGYVRCRTRDENYLVSYDGDIVFSCEVLD